MHISLSTLAVIMGLGLALPQIYGLANPKAFAVRVRGFPRSLPCGVALMLLATAWFVWNLNQESISDFANYKKWLLVAFTAIGIASCFYVQDFLAVRGLAVVFLLLAKLMVDTARWADTEWNLVVVTWAYVLVGAGIWFTIWPWNLRDLLNWATANDTRVRVGSAIRLGFGLFVAALGLTVFRSAG
jgi:hypothetical protein